MNTNEKTFLMLVEQNKSKINRICSVYAKNCEDQRDLVQDVLLNIWKNLPSFEHRASINTWLYRITLNVCMRSKYEQVQKRKTKLESVHLAAVLDISKDEKYEHLYHCISKLEETDRSIIVLFLEDLPYKEIAEIVGLSANHVAVKIKRIKKQLLICLQHMEREFLDKIKTCHGR